MSKTKQKLINYLLLVLVVLFPALHSIENSTISVVESFENSDALNPRKYSAAQLAEITQALEQKAEKIRIVSYNMLFALYDHNLDEINRWPQRLPRIVKLIKEMDADLIGVQELYEHQIRDLLPLIDDTYEFFAKPCEDGEQNGIFYRKTRFKVIAKDVVYMTETPTVPSSETLTMLTLEDLKTGKVFSHFNTHLAFGNIEKRAYQANFIKNKLSSLDPSTLVVLTGDLNTFPQRLDCVNFPFYDGDYLLRLLCSPTFRQASELSLLGHFGPLSTFTNGNDQDATPFKGTGTPGVMLDHVLISSHATVLMHAVESATVEGHFPSDHMPVIVDFLQP